jgi:UDP-glucose 4-epimerase
MHIFITGGAGFIGSHLVELHLSRGDSVVVVDDLSTGGERISAPPLKDPRCRFEKGDILTWEGLEEEIARADRIYHMAAVVGVFRVLQQPVEVIRVNVQGTERVLNYVARAKNHPQLLIASSSSVYGSSHARELREDIELIFSPEKAGLVGYALSKLTNEIQAMAYRQVHGISVAMPRIFNAVGPRQSGNYGFVLPRFIKQALSGGPLTVFGDGSQTRSFCDVRDTVVALDLLAGNPEGWGQPVNVGSTREVSILDLAKLVISRSGSSSQIEFVAFDKAYGEHFGHITQRRPVIEKLQQITRFQPAWTLERTIDDLLERNRANVVPNGTLL